MYFLKISDSSKTADAQPPVVRTVRWQTAGQAIDGEEREANGSWTTANISATEIKEFCIFLYLPIYLNKENSALFHQLFRSD